MIDIWKQEFDWILNWITTAGGNYTYLGSPMWIQVPRNNLNINEIINTHDVMFNWSKVFSGVCFNYINSFDNINQRNIITGDGYSLYNRYNEYDLVDDFLYNYNLVDIVCDTNIDITQTYHSLNGTIIRPNQTILLINQVNNSQNGPYIVSNNYTLSSITWNTNRYHVFCQFGTYQDKELYLQPIYSSTTYLNTINYNGILQLNGFNNDGTQSPSSEWFSYFNTNNSGFTAVEQPNPSSSRGVSSNYISTNINNIPGYLIQLNLNVQGDGLINNWPDGLNIFDSNLNVLNFTTTSQIYSYNTGNSFSGTTQITITASTTQDFKLDFIMDPNNTYNIADFNVSISNMTILQNIPFNNYVFPNSSQTLTFATGGTYFLKHILNYDFYNSENTPGIVFSDIDFARKQIQNNYSWYNSVFFSGSTLTPINNYSISYKYHDFLFINNSGGSLTYTSAVCFDIQNIYTSTGGTFINLDPNMDSNIGDYINLTINYISGGTQYTYVNTNTIIENLNGNIAQISTIPNSILNYLIVNFSGTTESTYSVRNYNHFNGQIRDLDTCIQSMYFNQFISSQIELVDSTLTAITQMITNLYSPTQYLSFYNTGTSYYSWLSFNSDSYGFSAGGLGTSLTYGVSSSYITSSISAETFEMLITIPNAYGLTNYTQGSYNFPLEVYAYNSSNQIGADITIKSMNIYRWVEPSTTFSQYSGGTAIIILQSRGQNFRLNFISQSDNTLYYSSINANISTILQNSGTTFTGNTSLYNVYSNNFYTQQYDKFQLNYNVHKYPPVLLNNMYNINFQVFINTGITSTGITFNIGQKVESEHTRSFNTNYITNNYDDIYLLNLNIYNYPPTSTFLIQNNITIDAYNSYNQSVGHMDTPSITGVGFFQIYLSSTTNTSFYLKFNCVLFIFCTGVTGSMELIRLNDSYFNIQDNNGNILSNTIYNTLYQTSGNCDIEIYSGITYTNSKLVYNSNSSLLYGNISLKRYEGNYNYYFNPIYNENYQYFDYDTFVFPNSENFTSNNSYINYELQPFLYNIWVGFTQDYIIYDNFILSGWTYYLNSGSTMSGGTFTIIPNNSSALTHFTPYTYITFGNNIYSLILEVNESSIITEIPKELNYNYIQNVYLLGDISEILQNIYTNYNDENIYDPNYYYLPLGDDLRKKIYNAYGEIIYQDLNIQYYCTGIIYCDENGKPIFKLFDENDSLLTYTPIEIVPIGKDKKSRFPIRLKNENLIND